MNIEFYTKNVYGNDLMYVADPAIAEHLTNLTGRVTIANSDMFALTKLGFTFTEVIAPKSK